MNKNGNGDEEGMLKEKEAREELVKQVREKEGNGVWGLEKRGII